MGKTVFTVKLDPELKSLMDRYPHINWSEVVREAIKRRISEEEEKNLAEALLINERLRRRAPKGWDSTEEIKKWRRIR